MISVETAPRERKSERETALRFGIQIRCGVEGRSPRGGLISAAVAPIEDAGHVRSFVDSLRGALEKKNK